MRRRFFYLRYAVSVESELTWLRVVMRMLLEDGVVERMRRAA